MRKERRETQEMLRSLQTQIEQYEQALRTIAEKERLSLKALETIEKQLSLYRAVLKGLEKNQEKLRREIELTQRELLQAEKELAKMKEDFARYAVGIYKFGVQRNEEVLFSAASLNQAIVRLEYIKRFEQAGKLKILDITAKKRQVAMLYDTLSEKYQENRQTLDEKLRQAAAFERRKKERETLLCELQKNKKKLKEELEQRQAKAKTLQAEINRLLALEEKAIEAERARAKEAEKRQREKKVAEVAPHSAAAAGDGIPPLSGEVKRFEDYRGRLPWPVRSGVIVRAFGENVNRTLKIVTFNNGVDISVEKGAEVFAVAPGKVTQVSYLPTFGNIVIIRHADGFITVYANLKDVRVAKGELVGARQAIGRVQPSENGNAIVHFEVWQGKEKHNPELWLAKN
ncbi:MAG: peptidoglycan DD-metalloendopeptidase family protein [Chloroherpetonaceae bacterium]|nr:peptidoglycan DD-metalloendopeptidase family protein [Chloroherpetonaceae bacterium]